MAFSLLEKAYTWNQKLNDIIIPYPLIYDTRLKCWRFQGLQHTFKSVRFPFYLTLSFIVLAVTFAISLSEIYHPTYLDTEEVLSTFLASFSVANGITMHYAYLRFGLDYAFTSNQTKQIYQKYLSLELALAESNREKWKILTRRQSEVQKVAKGTILIVLIETLMVTTMPLAGVSYNIDPMYSFFKLLEIYNPDIFSGLKSNIFVISIVSIASVLFIHVMCIGTRTSHIMMFSNGPLWMSVVSSLRSQKPSPATIRVYHQQWLLIQRLRPVLVATSSIVLSIYFLLLVFGINSVLVWFSYKQYFLAFCGALYMLYCVHNVMLGINLGCQLNENSEKLISNWKSFHGIGKYIRVTVRSLPVLTSPAGCVGVVDKDMKLNYIDNLVNYIVNLMVLT